MGEEIFYWVVFSFLVGGLCFLKYVYRGQKSEETSRPFKDLQNSYLIGFLLFKMADWLQGPYFYEVYKEKIIDGSPISDDLVARLFLFGFGSSMIFGTFVGGVVDKLGRKKGCLLFVVLYILSALTVHSNTYMVLIMGRIMGGIATSLLFSAPESWLVAEHRNGHYPEGWLGQLFGWMYFGDGIIAIIAGLVASFAANSFGPSGPFSVAVIFLLLGGAWVSLRWKENYGESNVTNSNTESGTNFNEAIKVIMNDVRILRLGLVQSLFEGAMYTFVLLWVPAIKFGAFELDWAVPPFGLIFSSYMVACMIGSTVFGVALQKNIQVERLALVIFTLASLCLFFAFLFSTSLFILLISFLVFEVCVGVYFPSIGTMRSKVIPEEMRATIMNLYRIPLNFIVISIFLNISSLGTAGSLAIASLALGLAAYFQYLIEKREVIGMNNSTSSTSSSPPTFQPISTKEEDTY